ncbi:hypothetical protein BSL78_28862 [Apostichopus japonicus]|uniref:Uncharacterized protein n=1 Tax=Stichopus japonicus TaxID=307972 RepID=A0A2G8JF11_STIJA|nr:hypothetical protein BSL78_28862 [Apostichopus japonicus]
MVILFLQTEGIIPTIEELREAAGCEEQLIIDGWDCSLRLDCTLYRRRREDDKPGDKESSCYLQVLRLSESGKECCGCERGKTSLGDTDAVRSLHPREQVARPGNYRLEFPMKDEHLTEELSRIHVDPERLREAWAERITCVLLEVLRDTLTVSCEKVQADLAEETSDSEETTESKMEVDPEEQEPPTKRQRMQENENDKDGPTVDIKPVTYSCSLKHDIWVGRRKMRRTLQRSGSSSSSRLALEKLVTEKLIEETGNGQDRDETLTEFHLEVTREIKDNAFVRFAMIPSKEKQLLNYFITSWKVFFQK